jgi:hypothetical protein
MTAPANHYYVPVRAMGIDMDGVIAIPSGEAFYAKVGGPMITYRPQRGGLAESLAEAQQFATSAEVRKHVIFEFATNFLAEPPDEPVYAREVQWKYYGKDERIGWDTYMITLRGYVMGFTNAPLEV